MSLSTEEYENIWLRIKEKIAKWVTGYLLLIIFLPITILTTIGLNELVDYKVNLELDKAIDKKLNSKEFTNKLINSTLNKLEEVKKEENDLNIKVAKLEKKIISLIEDGTNFPFLIEKNRITLSSENNLHFILEKGDCTSLGKIKFSKSFSNIPNIFVQSCLNGLPTKKITSFRVLDVTKNTFSITSNNPFAKFSWIAIGN